MLTLFKIISISVGILLFSGCANPSFNPNSKKIVFVEGKPFRVPYGASYKGNRFRGGRLKRIRKLLNKNRS